MKNNLQETIKLPSTLRGRSIHQNIIPTVCNLKNMLNKLISVQGDYAQLKQWERRSYQAYQIEKIKLAILFASEEQRKNLIKQHILNGNPNEFGASCIDIYLVAYVSETYGPGKTVFFDYIKKSGISEKENTAQAIWQVGKGDGVYLDVLNNDGTIRDWNFFAKWIKGNGTIDKIIATPQNTKLEQETNLITVLNQPFNNTDSRVIKRIKEKLNACGGTATIPLFNGDSCVIRFDSHSTGLVSPKIPPMNQLK